MSLFFFRTEDERSEETKLQAQLDGYCNFIGVPLLKLSYRELPQHIQGSFNNESLTITLNHNYDERTMKHELCHYLRFIKKLSDSSFGVDEFLKTFPQNVFRSLIFSYPLRQVHEEVIVRSLETKSIEEIKAWYDSLPNLT